MSTDFRAKRWRILRRCLLGAAVLVTLLAVFYTEESWRGQRAWEHCKRDLESRGIKMDWKAYIPAPVPDSENAFAIPGMQKIFLRSAGSASSDFMARLNVFSNVDRIGNVRLVLAEVKIGLQGTTPPDGFAVLSYGDPHAREQLVKWMEAALGPKVRSPWVFPIVKRRLDEIQPAKIWLQCQTMPATNEVAQFLPKLSNPEWNQDFSEGGRVESTGNDSYQVTMRSPITADDYLAWNAWLKPDLAVMREAFKRPYARVESEYQDPPADPFTMQVSELGRTLTGMADCHLLLDQPEDALDDLTLMHYLCRVREVQPGTTFALLSTLTRMVVTATSVKAIEDGLALHVWQDSQLKELQEQLTDINYVAMLSQVWQRGAARTAGWLETATPSQLGQQVLGLNYSPRKTNVWSQCAATLIGNLIPRGWIYQNMAKRAKFYETISDWAEPSGERVFPERVEAAIQLVYSHASPYTFLGYAGLVDLSRRNENTARCQTMVHEALIACALERYRLAHGAYPETLDTLVPQFLDKIPHDIIGGQPLHYHRAEDGKFILYSVGWNGTDDGGKPGSEDDWLWHDGH
jgi:hypothetical protein